MAWFFAGTQNHVAGGTASYLEFSVPAGREISVSASADGVRKGWWLAGWISQYVDIGFTGETALAWHERLPFGSSVFTLPRNAPSLIRVEPARWVSGLSVSLYYNDNSDVETEPIDAGTYG